MLAAIGIYGVISIGVAARTREFGVRIALGAPPASVIGLVLERGAWLLGTGVAAGLLGTIWVVRFLRGLLYGVSAFDGPTFVGATLLLIIIAMIACLLPARRATRVNPVVALQAD